MGKLRGYTTLVALTVALAVAGCGPKVELTESTGQDAETPTSVETTSTARETTSTVEPTSTTELLLGTVEDPFPVGPSVEFSYQGFGGEWEGTVLGLVEVPVGPFTDDEGRCLVVVGTLTPTEIDGGNVSNPFTAPGVSLIADGKLVDSGLDCDVEAVDAAGYGWILDVQVTLGTTFAFYDEFFLPGADPAEPEAIVVGNPSGGDAFYYEPTVLDTIPAPEAGPGAGPGQTDLQPVGPEYGFTYSDFGGEWEGTILGLVEVPRGPFSDDDGRCLVVVGTLTPTEIDEGTVTNPFFTPGVSIIAGGNLVDGSVLECDAEAVEAAGYGWILDAQVTLGTTYPFYDPFFLPGADPAEPEAIVVGFATGPDALYYEPTVLDTIPVP